MVHRELTRQSDQAPALLAEGEEPDLFQSDTGAGPLTGVDGHVLQTPLELRVCNWLYMAQLVHAHRRPLPLEELAYADFYLPQGSIYVDCWDDDVPASALSAKLRKRDLYKENALRHIEINADDADQLDQVLGRGLLSFGIRY